MAGERLEATMYTRNIIRAAAIREVLVCSTEPTNVGIIFAVKYRIRVKYSELRWVLIKQLHPNWACWLYSSMWHSNFER